ncbi:MAG: DUF2147 domain-containing protein [Bacteroidia bacterium]|nr:DUF2147 domain-containing protein [Bacteroidia bacterium]
MKKLLVLLVSFLTFTNLLAQTAAADADRIIGVWQTGSGKGRVQITKYGDKYGGKIVWLKEPNDENGKPKLDKKNPDVSKRQATTLGLNNLLGFKSTGKGKYEGGTIYDPENGKTYSCVMTLENDNVLKVRGYIGISLIGRTDTWTRVK